MGVIDATLKLVMVMVVVVVMMMMTTKMMTTTMTMMGIVIMMMMMMMMMLLIKKEVRVLKFTTPMSVYLNSYLAPEGLGNETKGIVLRLSNGQCISFVLFP